MSLHVSERLEIYSIGVVCCSICTDLPIDDAVEQVNEAMPPGVESRWAISEDETFASGHPNPFNCPDHSGRVHYLLNC